MVDLMDSLRLRCGLQLGNRMALAPLTNKQSHADGTLGADERAWLLRRARGGFGLISTCASYISPSAKAWDGQLGIAGAEHAAGLASLAAELRLEGAGAYVQLHHAGALASLAADKISASDDVAREVRAASEGDLEQVVEDFVAAALRAQEAGFDGAEIHGANGYLFTQFLAPRDNRRVDAFGGTIEGRARLLRMTTRAIRAAVRSDFALGVRISPVDGHEDRGLRITDSLQVAAWLAEDGIDFLHLSLSDAFAHAEGEPIVASMRNRLPAEVALLAVGGIWTAQQAREALSLGADVVALGKAAIANPDWPKRASDPGYEPLRPTWQRAALREVDVGAAFIEYLCKFPGVVEGGAPARSV